MKYLVTMAETDYFHAVIEANSREEAEEKAEEAWLADSASFKAARDGYHECDVSEASEGEIEIYADITPKP